MIVILDSDSQTRDIWTDILQDQDLQDNCAASAPGDAPPQATFLWVGNKGETPPKELSVLESDTFTRPVRVGDVLDRVRRHIASANQKSGSFTIPVGPYDLDGLSNDLKHRESGDLIRLTEKEKHILELLHAGQGEAVERKTLMDEVWGYAENVETHTLETHIYRLRQKIEKDPANPEILLTQEQGYSLK